MNIYKHIRLQNHSKSATNNVDTSTLNINTLIIVLCLLFINNLSAQISGCTDSAANNYNDNATINDGSCTYNPAVITIKSSTILDTKLKETSGLIDWNGNLYTHNDDTDTNLYKLNKSTGAIIKTIPLAGIQNIDWEEISQDETNIYIGDFGNNGSGNRTNLKIYKILKSSLETSPQIEIINFSYSNQANLNPHDANKTDFDCEAFVVTKDEILLFTKQWISEKTSVYSLPKTAGTHIANLKTTLDVSGLITGATLKEDSNLITLCGYSNTVQPFLYVIYDYNNSDFSTANKRKLNIPQTLAYHQIEAIASNNGIDYSLTNESLSIFTQKYHQVTIEPFISSYLNALSLKNTMSKKDNQILFPNPSGNKIHFNNLNLSNTNFEILTLNGQMIKKGQLTDNSISISDLKNGSYLIKFSDKSHVFKFIKK